MRKTKKRQYKKECLVRGNKVFFYGKMAELVQKAIDVAGITPEQFLKQTIQCMKEYNERSRKA